VLFEIRADILENDGEIYANLLRPLENRFWKIQLTVPKYTQSNTLGNMNH